MYHNIVNMSGTYNLGGFEQLVSLAILRLRREGGMAFL